MLFSSASDRVLSNSSNDHPDSFEAYFRIELGVDYSCEVVQVRTIPEQQVARYRVSDVRESDSAARVV